MFKSICLRRQQANDTEPLDLGFLAEAMLFYENVHLVADYGMLEQLLRHCEPDLLFEFMNEGFLKIGFLNSTSGVKTLNTGTPNEMYQPVSVSSRVWKLQEAAPAIFQNVTGKTGKGRRLGNRFAKRVHEVSHTTDIVLGIREDYANKEYIKKAVKQLLKAIVPEYQIPRYFHFNINADGDITNPNSLLKIDTNLDFVTSNGQFHLNTPSGLKPISPASLLVKIFDAKNDLYFSSLYESEIATSAEVTSLIQVKCSDLLSTRMRNENIIELFQEQKLENGHAIREVINSGERSYKDLFKLLQSAKKFRHWLQNQEPDIDLIKAYYKEVTASTWVEKTPSKILRWAILTATGIGLIHANPVVGIGVPATLSAADSLILEHLVRGWRPNQFIEKSLQHFVQPLNVIS